MNFLKRSFTSIFRKPAKSIVLLLLVFLLCNVIAGAISVRNALNMTKRSLLEKMGAEVRIQVDYDWIYNNAGDDFDWNSIQKIDKNIVDQLSTSPYVKRTDYLISNSFVGINLKSPNDGGIIVGPKDMIAEDPIDPGIEPIDPVYTPEWYFPLIGGTLPSLKAVEDGDIRITSGRCYNEAELASGTPVVLISEKLAELNGLSVGDTVTLGYNHIYWNESTGDVRVPCKKEFTIIGLFATVETPTQDPDPENQSGGKAVMPSYEYDQYADTMYTTAAAWNAFSEEIEQVGRENGVEDPTVYSSVEVTFLIDSIDNVEIFEIEGRSTLPMAYTFNDNTENLSEVAKPMENMKLISNIILYVAVGATVLILALLVSLFLKDRTREMGIYLSLGERKIRIATQIFAEVLIIALIAVSLSIFTGNILAGKLSGLLLENQLDTSQSSYWGSEMVTGQDFINEYDISLNGSTIAFIYLVGLGSVFVSACIPVFLTLRLKPRKILM